MNSEQFDEFYRRFEKMLDLKFDVLKRELIDHFEPRFQDIEGKIDWLIGAVDTDERERLALGYNFDRKHMDHEKRISKLELAARS